MSPMPPTAQKVVSANLGLLRALAVMAVFFDHLRRVLRRSQAQSEFQPCFTPPSNGRRSRPGRVLRDACCIAPSKQAQTANPVSIPFI
jgi:hypothetical protein